jgi:hypothetical protein
MQVVARHLDGRKIKGHTTDFHPQREYFRVTTAPGLEPIEVATEDLKAVFFVRTLEGDRERSDHREFPRSPGQVRQRIWLEFKDGERMAAWPVSTPLGQRGFYVIPTDPSSNVEKAYVFRAALVKVLQGDAAIVASRTMRSTRPMSADDLRVVRVL